MTRNKEILEHKLNLEKQYSELGMVNGRCRACDEIALPLAVYCRTHMGHDSQQLLFKYADLNTNSLWMNCQQFAVLL